MAGIDDERLLFYLRHADEIRAWAAIEREVHAAVREILSGLAPTIEDRLRSLDPTAVVSPWDSGGYQRLRAHRSTWPDGIGVALEWSSKVDPALASAAPKLGVLWTRADTARAPFTAAVAADGVLRLGYDQREQVWPVRRVARAKEWWQDVDAWTAGLVEAVAELWARVAPLIDRSLSAP